jgi:hypothetical protein
MSVLTFYQTFCGGAGAFFDQYVGEEPVSLKAKQDIGENIGRVLQKC